MALSFPSVVAGLRSEASRLSSCSAWARTLRGDIPASGCQNHEFPGGCPVLQGRTCTTNASLVSVTNQDARCDHGLQGLPAPFSLAYRPETSGCQVYGSGFHDRRVPMNLDAARLVAQHREMSIFRLV